MEQLERAAAGFRKRGIEARVFESGREAVLALAGAVDPGETVAFGGSVTLQTLGAYEALQERGASVLWHWRATPEEAARIRQEALRADTYVTSSNAVIADGRLLNTDGTGNRVAAMFFGPPRVIVIAGRNKLVSDYETAVERIRTVAAPMNAQRLNRDLPCRATGRCQDCRSPQRMCQVTVLLENRLDGRAVEVWLVNEDLGY